MLYTVSLLTFLLHSSPEAFVKPAEATLVPLVFVDDTLATEPDQGSKKTHILYVAFEELLIIVEMKSTRNTMSQ